MKKTKEAAPNMLLRQERHLRGWSQKRLAELLGSDVDPQNIRRWELGNTLPARYYQERLCTIFGKTAEELGFITIAHKVSQHSAVSDHLPSANLLSANIDDAVISTSSLPLSSSPIWNIPYRRNPFFTGRDEILRYLHNALTSNKTAALTHTYVINGLGGIGKTLTAVEYAYRYRDEYQAVLWARAETHELLVSDFVTIAGLLDLAEKTATDQSRVVQAVKQWLSRHSGWLLILDNADDLEVANEFIPAIGTGHTLLTTRIHATGSIAKAIEIKKMELHEAILLLMRRAKLLENDAQIADISEDNLSKAKTIALLMDNLPLALDQAGAYIEETGCGLSGYLAIYQTRRTQLLQRRGRYVSTHPEPVAATWSLSFEKVKQINPAAAELLQLCAFLHPDSIPEAMLSDGGAALGPTLTSLVENPLAFNEAVADLLRYSLLRRNSGSQTIIIHRLVQDVVKDQMERDLSHQWITRVLLMLYQAFAESDFTTWQHCQRYLPHVQTCALLMQQHAIIRPEAAQLLYRAASYLRKHGQLTEAEPLLAQALEIYKHLLGPRHSDTIEVQSELATVYYEQGTYTSDEVRYQKALSTY